MTRMVARRHRPRTGYRRIFKDRYILIVTIILIIVTMASFYIYQRVWVRNLITEIEQLEKKNETARTRLASLKSEWMLASSIANIESTVDSLRLGLRPTTPSQNLALRLQSDWERSRYAGLIKALEKLKGNIPLVSPNEAEAKELFEAK